MGLLARMEVLHGCDADVSEAVDKKFVADYFLLLRKSACSGATVMIDRLQRIAADHPTGVRIYNHIPAREQLVSILMPSEEKCAEHGSTNALALSGFRHAGLRERRFIRAQFG
jgi:hypothetical protein